MARVSLTQKQLKTEEGKELLDLLMRITRDGVVEIDEIEELRDWLEENEHADLPAAAYLREVIATIWDDNEVDFQDQWDMLLAIEKVVPPEERSLVKMRRRETPEPATQRQKDFLQALGVKFTRDLSKFDAMELIDDHKESERAQREWDRQVRGGESSRKRKKKDESLGCSGWAALIVLALVAISYCRGGE